MKTANIMLRSLKNAEMEVKNDIPAGYVPIKLSTQGKLGAPSEFHIRNFKVREVLALSLTSDENLPIKLIHILNDMIYEDIDVADFHEKEVEELMVLVYMSFYKASLENVPFELEDSDVEFLKNDSNGEELIKAILNKEWKPCTTINLQESLETYDLDEDFNPRITIRNKTTGFYCTFDYIRYGDRLTVKKWLDNIYSEEEMKFRQVKSQIMHNNEAILSKQGMDNIIPIDPALEDEYNEYVNDRLQKLLEVSRLISIVDYNGKDVSHMPIADKYELMADDPQIDYGMIKKLASKQNSQPVGIKPMVNMYNPITHQMCTRRFAFRLPTILQAMQLYGDDKYDDGTDDPDRDNMD